MGQSLAHAKANLEAVVASAVPGSDEFVVNRESMDVALALCDELPAALAVFSAAPRWAYSIVLVRKLINVVFCELALRVPEESKADAAVFGGLRTGLLDIVAKESSKSDAHRAAGERCLQLVDEIGQLIAVEVHRAAISFLERETVAEFLLSAPLKIAFHMRRWMSPAHRDELATRCRALAEPIVRRLRPVILSSPRVVFNEGDERINLHKLLTAVQELSPRLRDVWWATEALNDVHCCSIESFWGLHIAPLPPDKCAPFPDAILRASHAELLDVTRNGAGGIYSVVDMMFFLHGFYPASFAFRGPLGQGIPMPNTCRAIARVISVLPASSLEELPCARLQTFRPTAFSLRHFHELAVTIRDSQNARYKSSKLCLVIDSYRYVLAMERSLLRWRVERIRGMCRDVADVIVSFVFEIQPTPRNFFRHFKFPQNREVVDSAI